MRGQRWNFPEAEIDAESTHGLVAWLKQTRVVLPLKGVECRFEVCGAVVEVWIDQIYHQNNSEALDCTYQFPLPADAAVFACEININGRLIRARVEEREEARRLATEKKAAGHRTGLVEMERENLFTLSLGNVQPDDLVVVRLGYFQPLRHLGTQRTVEIPFSPGVRYIPGKPLLRSNVGQGTADDTDQVPDASRISPPRMDRLHPDAAYLSLQGRLDREATAQESIGSPTHPVGVRENGQTLDICLADGAALPDRDFVLRWEESPVKAVTSRAWTHQQEGYTYALLEIKAPAIDPEDREPMDFYFLVDRSGSMSGEKWTKAVEALQTAVKGLGHKDRVMITFFESSFLDFAEKPLSRDRVLADPAFHEITNLGTAGGTELVSALSHQVELWKQHSGERSSSLILITDAQVGNEQAVLEVGSEARSLPIHCFGIDHALNDALLMKLARHHNGTFHSLKPGDDIVGMVSGLVSTAGQPLARELEPGDAWEKASEDLQNLYPSQTIHLALRSREGDAPLSIKGCVAGKRKKTYKCTSIMEGTRAVASVWSQHRIDRLVSQSQSDEAIALSKAANLICELTAFVAWDEQEKVVVAQESLAQPSFEDILSCSRLNEVNRDMVSAAESLRLLPRPMAPGTRRAYGTSGSGLSLFGEEPVTDVEQLRSRLEKVLNDPGVADLIPLSMREALSAKLKSLGSRDTVSGRRILQTLLDLVETHERRMTELQQRLERVTGQLADSSQPFLKLGRGLCSLTVHRIPRDIQRAEEELSHLLEELQPQEKQCASLLAEAISISREIEKLGSTLKQRLDRWLQDESVDGVQHHD